MRGVCQDGLVGVDVVEAAPSLEAGATSPTSLIAGRVALEAMAAHLQAAREA